jgi:hypothetical protein
MRCAAAYITSIQSTPVNDMVNEAILPPRRQFWSDSPVQPTLESEIQIIPRRQIQSLPEAAHGTTLAIPVAALRDGEGIRFALWIYSPRQWQHSTEGVLNRETPNLRDALFVLRSISQKSAGTTLPLVLYRSQVDQDDAHACMDNISSKARLISHRV